ncbi:serine/threonine-protein kinase [Marinilabilia salmonicolor]|uniref:serine/threonine-protein kinase n=1 Tax=Marinilabilia salmonicolor TaxID=989 RepID=UPI000299F2F1|nr:serine/threonine-protein kinase [Marinilabilia salmonicolor]
MDIISDEIWPIIEPYIDEDIASSENIEDTLRELKDKYPQYYKELKALLERRDLATSYFSRLSESIRNSISEKVYPVGYQIGVYEIIELISGGGMSHVYRARRTDGEYEQQVAIKVLKESLYNEPLKEQFRREKQILADLNHPHIASIYDSGLTEEGRPYFIMEFIEGLPITDYCNQHNLSIDNRLELFIDVCQAVNYAHQNLIIHKDLKPGNIFIDKNGFLKLMDFGISRISEEVEPNKESLQAYTPRYASPEQKNNGKVTTLSDVYQLGLLLCNLLTGIHWQDITNNFKHPSVAAIFETYPGNDVKTILAHRGLENTKQLSDILKGDLQALLTTSLREKPAERYRTVQELQTDVENYFNNQPLKARGLHFNYLLSKFVKRNRTLLQIASFFLIVITGLMANYTIAITQQKNRARENARKAELQASKAQNVTDYLKSVFSLGDPYVNSANDITVDEMLDKGYNRLTNAIHIDPDIKAEILLTMSTVFMENGSFDKALQALKNAHHLKDSLKPDNHHDLSDIYSNYASFYRKRSQLDTAFYFIDKALKIDSINAQTHPVDLTYDLEILGNLHALKTDYQQAVPIYKEVLRRMNEENDFRKEIKIAGVESTLGEIYHRLSDYSNSKKYLLRSYKVHASMKDSTNEYLINDLSKIALLYLDLEKLDSAEYFMNQCIKKTKQTSGDSAINLVHRYYTASSIQKKKNNFGKSISYAEAAYEISLREYGKNHIWTAFRLNTIGLTYAYFGMHQKAEKYYKQGLKIKEKHYPQYVKSIITSKYNLADAYLKQGKAELATSIFQKVYETEKNILPEGHPNIAFTLTRLGRSLMDAGKPNEAYPHIEKAYAIIDEKFDSIHSRRGDCATLLAEYYLKMQKWTLANKFATEGMTIFNSLHGKDHWKYEYTSALKLLAQSPKKNSNLTKQLTGLFQSLNIRQYPNQYFINQLQKLAGEKGFELRLKSSIN